MGSIDLHRILKDLCVNSEWKYAVFWKVKHRARMVLTWEDAYYVNFEQHDASQEKCLAETVDNMHGGFYSHDPIGLAVAKMSYHVYSLGEGIVGQVAVSGKHRWIFADGYSSSFSSFELYDGWQSQFEAGIKTIAVVAVVPYGVVQLGSSNKVVEDMKMVGHIRNVFSALQDASTGHISGPIRSSMESPLHQPMIPAKSTISKVMALSKARGRETLNDLSPEKRDGDSSDSLHVFTMPSLHLKREVNEVNKQEGLALPTVGSDCDANLISNASSLELQNEAEMNSISQMMRESEINDWKNMMVGLEHDIYADKFLMGSSGLTTSELPAEIGVSHTDLSTNLVSSVDRLRMTNMQLYQNEVLKVCESSDVNDLNGLQNLGSHNDLSHLDSLNDSSKFSAGYELYEALGPAFLKKSSCSSWQSENIESKEGINMEEGMSSSQLTFDSGSENLLEAVIANVCNSAIDIKSDRSFGRTAPSLLTTENMPALSKQTRHTTNSGGYSINQTTLLEEHNQSHVSSPLSSELSSKGFSSTHLSTCSEKLERSLDAPKSSKKRAKAGESCRPRPRDRQLIQDRIKELRELVPNGGKCSIDSLLERTIKHMLFLQSVTKHADKLNKCAELKMNQKGAGTLGPSNHEQGSSWAVEVGSHLKVCSIVVENLNHKSGQMLVEMLCEECSHFLEIAEAIRSLGLAILKGITEAHGDKTWICFVVEGQNNRVMHRMDILWSLVQVLQQNTSA